MADKPKLKDIPDDFDDNEVAEMLELDTPNPSDPVQWVSDDNGDLDWSYTTGTVRKWSPDALVTHLWEKSFAIPPREYNPSAPFVWVVLHSGEVVTLPHGYRLPLMFVAKYRWEITLMKITDERVWKQEKANIFHLCRLCENLFRRAQAKASRGGMEKGWRCLMFDRLLARFYKHWSRNDPQSGRGFMKTHGMKEYERDVLKHDWKRWCLRGLNGVKMTEEEVANGISIDKFRKGLRKGDDGVWMLDDLPVTHINDEEPSGDITSSDLTDFSTDEDDDSSDDDVEIVSTIVESMQMQTPAPPHPKRLREIVLEEYVSEREIKRTRIDYGDYPTYLENFPYSKNTHIGKLPRTFSAMSHHPIWANMRPGDHADDAFSGPSGATHINQDAVVTNATPMGDVVLPAALAPPMDIAIPVHSPPASSASQSHDYPQDEGPSRRLKTTALTFIDPTTNTPNVRRVPIRHASQDVEADGSFRLDPIYIPTTSFFTSDRADKYPWPPALGVHHSRTTSEIRMFQECTQPSTWSSDEGITWRAAGTLGWGDEKVWRAAAQATTSEEALALAQATAGTSRPPRIASVRSRQLTKEATKGAPRPSKPRDKGKERERAKDRDKDKEKEKETPGSIRARRARQTAAATAARMAARARAAARSQSSVSSLSSAPPTNGAGSHGSHSPPRRHPDVSKASNAPNISNAEASTSANAENAFDGADAADFFNGDNGPDMDYSPSGSGAGSGGPSENGLHAKALELLVNMLDVRQGLDHVPKAGLSSTISGTHSTEKAALEDRFVEIDGRFSTMKDELVGIVGRLQALEQMTDAEKGGRLATLRQEEEEGEEEEHPVNPEGATEIGGGSQNVSGRTRNKGATALSTHLRPKRATAKAKTPTGSGSKTNVSQKAGSDKDVNMDDASQRTSDEISTQTDLAAERRVSHPPPTRSTPQQENGTTSHSQVSAKARATPSTSGNNSPQVVLHSMETVPDAHQNASSEPDTDITMVNAAVPSSAAISALLKEELDPRTREMSSNLNLLVDSLVSAKMLALMEGMVQTRVVDKEAEAAKEKEQEHAETDKEGSIASSSGDVDIVPPTPHPLLGDSVTLTQSPDTFAVAQLLDEVRNMQKQLTIREQSEKEEIRAMRELHSAEVDALRRRLTYLESQQQRRGDMLPPIPSSSSSHPHSHSTPAESSSHSKSRSPMPTSRFPAPGEMPTHWRQKTPFRASEPREHENSDRGQSSASPLDPGTTPPLKEPPVRIYTDRNFAFRRTPGKDDLVVPLPIKSQRKQHMVFPRSQYG